MNTSSIPDSQNTNPTPISSFPGKLVSCIPETTAPSGELRFVRQELLPETLTKGLISGDDLGALEIIPRECFCGSWFRRGDLGFIFAERGLGKTWFAMSLSQALAEGHNFGPWVIQVPRRVLYIDGEMPFDGLRERHISLRKGSGSVYFLNHEHLFDKTKAVLNLTGAIAQASLTHICKTQKIDVLFLDNLSCLFSGMVENDANDWEQVLPWLLDLRRQKIAVVIIHHSGRAGQNMRGTSRREDAATWVVRLGSVADPLGDTDGARFVSRFVKNRQGRLSEMEEIEWHFDRQGDSTLMTFNSLPTVATFKQLVGDGLNSCSEIAEEMGISKAAVCKIAKRGVVEGWLRIKGRTYHLVTDSPEQ